MAKIILILLFTLSFLFSQDDEKFPFVGVGVSAQTVDINNQNNTENTISLHYGRQTLNWRTYFSYEFKSSDYQSLSVEIDKILLDELFGTPKLRPYLGLSGGILKYKDDSLEDTDGFYYGGNSGFIIYLTDTIDLDLSYHYNIVQEIKTVDSIQGATFSLHYFY
ncbi:hypothetical protein [Sulfurovum sp.]|uniref:hypothetical protein n=1 Tax=Sulfurovum sp. TaxID=1969726 RepID=UPI003567A68E